MDALELNFNQENFCAGYALMGEDEALKSYVKDKFLDTIPVDERGFAYVVVDINSSKNVEELEQQDKGRESYIHTSKRRVFH